MKRFISHMLLFILLAMMLAGCSGDAPEVVAEPSTPKPVVSPDDGEIRFKVGTEWQGKGDTRALLFADADALVTEGSFKVYAYVGTTTNAHIDGSIASYSEGEWVFTDGKHYWPQSESLNFVTYMPATAPDYITNIGYSADNGPSFDCTNLPNNSTNQTSTKEFLYAYEQNKTKAADAANMSLTFHRPFSIVSLRLSKAHPGLTITSIKFKNIYNNGSFTYGNSPKWTPSGSKTDFTATIDSYTNSGSSPIPLGGPYLMMPQSFAGGQQTIEITATCSAWDPTSQAMSISFPIEAWLPGQSYSYNITISGVTEVTEVKMKNVKRTVSVAPTTSSAGVGSAESSTDGNGDEILIFSGSNTSSETQTYACVFPAQAWNNTDFITVTADSKTVTYQLNRSTWTAGAEYELTFHLNAVALNTTISITGWTDSNPSVVVNPSANTGLTLTISDIDAQTYTGSALTPAVTVTDGETDLTEGTHYELSWNNNTNAGVAMVAAIGIGTYFGQFATQTFVINKAAGSISYETGTVNKTTGDSPFTNELTKTGDGIVSFESTDTGIATVNDEGLVTIVAAGTTTITATVADGANYTYNSKTATYTLTVN